MIKHDFAFHSSRNEYYVTYKCSKCNLMCEIFSFEGYNIYYEYYIKNGNKEKFEEFKINYTNETNNNIYLTYLIMKEFVNEKEMASPMYTIRNDLEKAVTYSCEDILVSDIIK